MVVREGRGSGAGKIDAIGVGIVRERREGRRLHAGEVAVGAAGGGEGGRIGDAAAPLEDEGYRGQGEGEESEEQEDP